MSNTDDFIIENGVLKGYTGPGGNVVIPEEVTEIFGAPFVDSYEPITLTLSNNMKCNQDDLLCQGLEILNIPAGTDFAPSSFGPNHGPFFTNLKEINVNPENASCASENGILYSKDKSVLYSCPAAYEKKVVIPDSVKVIASHAFDGCKSVKEVILPDSVVEIAERAFMDCKSLSKVVLPSGLIKIGKEAFLRCGKLTTAGLKGTGDKKGYSYEFPWTEEIPENAFSGMNKLKKVVLPDTISVIRKDAFKGCKSLEEINLPENVKCDKKTFKDCTKLSI